jgi:hypothetical protein
MDGELEAIYRYVYESLDLEFDLQYVRQARRQIAEILRKHAATKAAEDVESDK